MHPQRFHALVNSEWPGVVRSKGFFWLATRPAHAGSWSQAGAVCRHGLAGKWWAAVPREKWPQDQESIDFILEQWDDNVGDARQELVMIGMEMDQAALTAKLEACLLTDAEMAQGPMGWARMADPFPGWE
jgi:G3E family GTPase